DLENSPLLSGHYQPPAIETPAPTIQPTAPAAPVDPFQIPADYDPLSPDEPEEPWLPPQPVPQTATPSTPAPAPRTPTPTPTPLPTPPPIPVTGASQPEPRKTPAPEPPPSPAPTSDPGLVAVLEGAGLQRAPVTAEFARSFGQIFRVVVEGVMDVHRARQQIKGEFRMRLTQFRAADNNPLKFSANIDDALHNLLVKRNAAYLEPVAAFED